MKLQHHLGHVRSLLFALSAILVLGRAAPADARGAGFATASCDSCHRGGRLPKVTISLSPMLIDPGGTTTVTVTITQVNGGPGGFYLHSRGFGTFQEVPGSGTRLPTSSEVVHAGPKPGSAEGIVFQARWTAPAKGGSYSIEALAVSANGNNAITGDGAGVASIPFTVGCSGMTVYADVDGDGFGSDMIPPSRACEAQPGFVTKAGDCNDYRATVYPGAPEICDEYDNDCDKEVNEGLEMATVYRDADGDGHGGRFTTDMRVGCAEAGYSTLRDDCKDDDREVFPGAKEICNNKDDNCNGRVDEGARLTCGKGYCRAVADSCASTACTPGEPRDEQCNLIDDDCDGVIDNDAPCDPGRVCVTGRCLSSDDAKAVMEAFDGGAPPSGGGGAGGGGGSGGGRADGGVTSDDRRRSAGCQYGGTGHSGEIVWVVGLAGAALLRRRRGSAPR